MLFWPRSHCLHTLIVDTKQPAFLCVTTKTYQHLIGCAAWGVVGLSVCEDSQFPGCFLWTVPKAEVKSKVKVTKKPKECDDDLKDPGNCLWTAAD